MCFRLLGNSGLQTCLSRGVQGVFSPEQTPRKALGKSVVDLGVLLVEVWEAVRGCSGITCWD